MTKLNPWSQRQVRYAGSDGSAKWWPAKVGQFDPDDMTFPVQFDESTEYFGLEEMYTTDVRKIISPSAKKRKAKNSRDARARTLPSAGARAIKATGVYSSKTMSRRAKIRTGKPKTSRDAQLSRARTSPSAGPRAIKATGAYSATAVAPKCSMHADVSATDYHDAPAVRLPQTTANTTEDVEQVAWYCRRCTMGNPASASVCIMCDLRPPSSRKKLTPDSLSTTCAAATTVVTTGSRKHTAVKVKTERHSRHKRSSRRNKPSRKPKKIVDPETSADATRNIVSRTPPADAEILMECVICFDALKCMVMLPCSHLCVCESCAVNLNACPTCRQTVTNKHKIYWT